MAVTGQGPGFGRRNLLQFGAAGLVAASLPGFAQAQAPKRGGKLRIGLGGGQTANTLDQTAPTFASPNERTVNYTLFNTLVEIDPNGKAVPELAESWEVGPGAKRWVFNLRRGVTFHNGKEMTADDVVFSLRRHSAEGSRSGALALMRDLESISKLDKYQIEIVHKTGSLDVHYLMSDYHFSIVPDGDNSHKGMGTGPYVLQAWEPGVRFHGKRNPNYWKSGRGHVDEVEITVVNDDLARLSALQSGEVDIINRLDPRTVRLVEAAPALKSSIAKGYGFYTVNMRADMAPFNNPDLRLALKHLINRKELLDRILRGYGSLGNDHPIAAAMPFHANLPQREMDLDKAKFHFQKSGFSGTVPLHTSTAVFSSAIDMAVLMQAQAQKIGMNISVERQPPDGYWGNIWLKEPFHMSYWTGRITTDIMLSTGYSSTAAWNEAHWKNPHFDELLVKARTEFDEAKRAAMYAECQSMLRDDGGVMIPLFNSFIDAAKKSVGGDLVAPNMELAGGRIAERAWLG
jgi:peptide/nickel transport system substrate-binding protein